MQDLRDDVAGLKARLRLQMLMLGGLLAALVLSAGGADVVARTLIESDAWKVRTKKADLATVVDRIVVTTDVDNARIKILNANIELARQATLPSSGLVEGMLGYDSTAHALKFYNGTGWVASGGGGGGTATLGKGFVGGRLMGGATTLSYGPWINNIIEVNNEYVVITSGMFFTTAMTLIDSAGNNTATTMADYTTYYAYISNSQVAWAPNALRCSATGVLNGYLGTTGNAANWRCVGMVRLSGGQFTDTDARRWIFNSYNKIPKRLYTAPGYVDDGVTTTLANSNTSWAGITLTGYRLDFLTDMSSYPEIYADVTVKVSGGDCLLGIADVNQPAQTQTLVQPSVYTNVHLKHYSSNNMFDHSQYCELQLKVTGGTATIMLDAARVQPLVPDSKVTLFYGTIWN